MKNLFLSLVLVLTNLVASSQEPTYFYPNFEELFVLDSLNIPYLPIPERNGISPVGRTYSTEKSVKKHNKYFNNNEFDFLPSQFTPSIKLESFFNSYRFLTEIDETIVMMMSQQEFDIIGFSSITLPKGKYKSVQILEYHANNNDTYGTIVLLQVQSGEMTLVNQTQHPVSLDWQPVFE
jgi:hypothetical protein